MERKQHTETISSVHTSTNLHSYIYYSLVDFIAALFKKHLSDGRFLLFDRN